MGRQNRKGNSMADLGMLTNIRADGSIKASNDIDKVSGSADALEKRAKVAGKAADVLAGRV